MTELERAVQWLEYLLQVKKANERAYPHRAQDVGAVHHCRVLLDALRKQDEPCEYCKNTARSVASSMGTFDMSKVKFCPNCGKELVK